MAFGALLQYLYTGCLDVGVEHVSDCERLARQCQLWGLLGGLEAKREWGRPALRPWARAGTCGPPTP